MSNLSEARMLIALQRELQVLGYRKAGLSYRQIASHMNITGPAAFKSEIRALKRMDARTCEAAKQLRILVRMRLADMEQPYRHFVVAEPNDLTERMKSQIRTRLMARWPVQRHLQSEIGF